MSSGKDSIDPVKNNHLEQDELPELHELLGIRAIVHPDGDEATIRLRTSQGRIDLSVSLAQVGAADAEIRSAANLMHYRQSMKKDAGLSAFDDLLHTAVHPTETSIYVDGATGDRLFVLHFADDRLPMVVRRSPEQLAAILEEVSDICKRAAN
ncbi:hypothetical protein NKI48_03075 [Mesorhizobium sp. M0644]|uniref:hypothetical protein n=1 Tax=unclassified Mesorhizobium TaxID=325217 RepID=UPI003339FE1A